MKHKLSERLHKTLRRRDRCCKSIFGKPRRAARITLAFAWDYCFHAHSLHCIHCKYQPMHQFSQSIALRYILDG